MDTLTQIQQDIQDIKFALNAIRYLLGQQEKRLAEIEKRPLSFIKIAGNTSIDRLKSDIVSRAIETGGEITSRQVVQYFGSRQVGCKFNCDFVKSIFLEMAEEQPEIIEVVRSSHGSFALRVKTDLNA